MILYFNIIVCGILGIAGIIGYFNGIIKISSKLLIFIIILIVCWLLSSIVCNYLLRFDLSKTPLEMNLYNQPINKITDIIIILLSQLIPSINVILSKRHAIPMMIDKLAFVVLRIVVLIILILLFNIIKGIVDLLMSRFIKLRPKITIKNKHLNQLGGMGLGIINGLVIIFLISIPISGTCSIASMINNTIEVGNTNYQNSDSELRFVNNYRRTIPGMIFGFLKLKDTPVDEYVFDEILTVEYQERRIQVRNELEVYLEVYELINKTIPDKTELADPPFIREDVVREVFRKVKKANSLNLIIPLFIDVYCYSNLQMIVDEGIYNVDYYDELQYLEAILIILNSDEFKHLEESTNIQDVDHQIIISMAANLSNLKIIDSISNDISSFIISNWEIRHALRSLGLMELSLENINWRSEIENGSSAYQYIMEVNEELTDENISNLSLILYNSDIFNQNNQQIVQIFIEKYLPTYTDKTNISCLDFDDIRSITRLAKILVDKGFFEKGFKTSKLYDEQTINSIIDLITSSTLLSNNLEVIMKVFIGKSILSQGFSLIIPEIIDWKSEEGREELSSLFAAFKILEQGITQKNLEDNYQELHELVINSKLISVNFDNFLKWAIAKYITDENQEYGFNRDVIAIDVIDWNSDERDIEVLALMNVLKLMLDKDMIDSNYLLFLQFTKEELEILLSSKIIYYSLINMIYYKSTEKDSILYVTIDKDASVWEKTSKEDGELRSFIYALQVIFKDCSNTIEFKIDPEVLMRITDGSKDTNGDGVVDEKDSNDLKVILKSKIMSDTIIKFIFDQYQQTNNSE